MAKNETITMTREELAALVKEQVQASLLGTLTQLSQATQSTSALAISQEAEARLKKQQEMLDLGVQVLSQRNMDKAAPPIEGVTKPFKVRLDDRNGWPELIVHARSPIEAQGAYSSVCGILSVEEPANKWRIEAT